MMRTGKCPKCEMVLQNVAIQNMPIHKSLQPEFEGVSYVCSNCQTILGVGIDPFFLKGDMIDEMLKILGR